ncbi:hypothetical protein ABZ192_20465 [Streptomyces sp. NPDC006235]|uniref:hypothetical protein n=1 Tax=Streptomyces sp. NPDC006235 TaxID=3156736 RepID=UPI0033B96889
MNLSLGVKVLVVIICALVSVIIGMVAGLLNHDPGTPKRKSVIFGGGVFGGSLTLAVVVLSALGVL